MRPFHPAQFKPSSSAMAVAAVLAHRDIHPARADEISEARDMAARRIGSAIVGSDALQQVQDRSGSALFVTRGPSGLTGVLAIIPLTLDGLRALETGQFDGLSPKLEQITSAGEEPAALYVWGIAAVRKMAGAWLSNGLLAVFDEAVPHLPIFATPATPQGDHLLRRVGFESYPGSSTGLLRREPAALRRVAA